MATIAVNLPLNVGVSGTYLLFLYDGSTLLNSGGDTLTEVANGYYTATVAETVDASVVYRADVTRNGTLLYSGWLQTRISDVVDAPALPPDGWSTLGITNGGVIASGDTFGNTLVLTSLGPAAVWDYFEASTGDDAVDKIAAAIGSPGPNARTISITVESDSNAISGVRIEALTDLGAPTSQQATTGTLGTATLYLDDGEYLLRVLPPNGYDTPDDIELTVDGAETVAIELTARSVPVPDNPLLATLVVSCVDQEGAVEPGVTIEVQMQSIPTGSTGIAFDSTPQTAISDSDGLAMLTVVRQATYRIRRGTSKTWQSVTIANAASTTVTSFIGAP
jgi:hypothetical protein